MRIQGLEIKGWALSKEEVKYKYSLCPAHYIKLSGHTRRLLECQGHPDVKSAIHDTPLRDSEEPADMAAFFLKNAGALRKATSALEITAKIEA